MLQTLELLEQPPTPSINPTILADSDQDGRCQLAVLATTWMTYPPQILHSAFQLCFSSPSTTLLITIQYLQPSDIFQHQQYRNGAALQRGSPPIVRTSPETDGGRETDGG